MYFLVNATLCKCIGNMMKKVLRATFCVTLTPSVNEEKSGYFISIIKSCILSLTFFYFDKYDQHHECYVTSDEPRA